MLPSLARRNPIVVQISQQPQHSCRHFLFFCGNRWPFFGFLFSCSSTLWCGNKKLIPGFASPFLFCKIGTRAECQHSQSDRVQVLFKWYLHGYRRMAPLVTFAMDTSFLRHTSTSWQEWLRRCGGSVFWFLRTIVTLMPETAMVSFRTLAFFLSTGNRYLFLLQRHLSPFDSWTLLLIQLSLVWRQNFVIEFSDLYFLFTIVFNFWQVGIDIFWWISMSYNSNTVLSFSDSRILNFYNPSKMSSGGIFVIDNNIPSHFESNSWISSGRLSKISSEGIFDIDSRTFIPSCIEFLNIIIMKRW